MIPFNTDFDTEVKFATDADSLPEDPPFHMLFLGDWSGRESRSDVGSPKRRPIFIDRDNFDETLDRLNVGLELDLNDQGKDFLTLRFKELDDFHPDRIFQQIPLFSELRDIRKKLLNNDTFEQAAREVRSWFNDSFEVQSEEIIPEDQSGEVSQISTDSLLDQILDQGEGSASSPRRQTTQSTELSSLISKLVKPHLIKTDEQEQAKLLDAVDETTSELMRSILHHPQFQALEAAWRGLYLVVRRAETGVDLKIFILDISKDELSDNLKSVNDLTESMIYDVFIKDTLETPGGEPWAVFCGNYNFGVNVDDIATLMRLSQLANNANAPFISHIKPDMFGISSFAETPDYREWKISDEADETKLWNTLRSMPEAKYLGLATPRFLARLPYGAKSDPTETFSFEELIDDLEHKHFLWSNPNFFCALLLAQSYRVHGWEMGSGLFQDIDGLPIYMYEDDGETKTKPCAEVVFTETGCNKILEEGLMPLLSFRNTDKVHLARFQSIASPMSALKSRWS
jgi:type VI secretion system protein ImpC